MTFQRLLVLATLTSLFQTASAFAVAKMTCEQAADFLNNDSYRCDDGVRDCSRGECVDVASCRYIKGVVGFTIGFSYPTNCDFDFSQNSK